MKQPPNKNAWKSIPQLEDERDVIRRTKRRALAASGYTGAAAAGLVATDPILRYGLQATQQHIARRVPQAMQTANVLRKAGFKGGSNASVIARVVGEETRWMRRSPRALALAGLTGISAGGLGVAALAKLRERAKQRRINERRRSNFYRRTAPPAAQSAELAAAEQIISLAGKLGDGVAADAATTDLGTADRIARLRKRVMKGYGKVRDIEGGLEQRQQAAKHHRPGETQFGSNQYSGLPPRRQEAEELRKAAYMAIEAGRRAGNLGRGSVAMAKDIRDVVMKKPRDKDRAGRPKLRQWEKRGTQALLLMGAGTAAAMGAAHGVKKFYQHEKFLAENPGEMVNRGWVQRKVLGKDYPYRITKARSEKAAARIAKMKGARAKAVALLAAASEAHIPGLRRIGKFVWKNVELGDGRHLICFDDPTRAYIVDPAGNQVFRVQDVRGNSMRVFKGEAGQRKRRQKHPHERVQAERARHLRDKLIIGAAGLAGMGGAYAAGRYGRLVASRLRRTAQRATAARQAPPPVVAHPERVLDDVVSGTAEEIRARQGVLGRVLKGKKSKQAQN